MWIIFINYWYVWFFGFVEGVLIEVGCFNNKICLFFVYVYVLLCVK